MADTVAAVPSTPQASPPPTAPAETATPADVLSQIGEGDLFHRALKLISHQRFTFIAIVLSAAMLVPWACQSTTVSPFTGQKVTRDQLAAESNAVASKNKLDVDGFISAKKQEAAALQLQVDTFIAGKAQELGAASDKVKAAIADLDTKDAIRQQIFGLLNSVASAAGQTLGPTGSSVATGVLGILALGLGGDSLRQRRIINKLADAGTATA